MLGWLVQQTPEQRQAAMAAAARAATAEHVRPPPRRPVGRPAKRPVVQLESAADEPEQKKRKYTQWFSLPLIHDILAAYRVCSYSARATVAYLQRSHLEIYADLTESTVRSWFDASTHQLHPQFERLLITREYATPAGPKRVFDGFPETRISFSTSMCGLFTPRPSSVPRCRATFISSTFQQTVQVCCKLQMLR
jgi:hypothetical protein